jgi:hypothetical protein
MPGSGNCACVVAAAAPCGGACTVGCMHSAACRLHARRVGMSNRHGNWCCNGCCAAAAAALLTLLRMVVMLCSCCAAAGGGLVAAPAAGSAERGAAASALLAALWGRPNDLAMLVVILVAVPALAAAGACLRCRAALAGSLLAGLICMRVAASSRSRAAALLVRAAGA